MDEFMKHPRFQQLLIDAAAWRTFKKKELENEKRDCASLSAYVENKLQLQPVH
jgi:hypothetical protein